MMNKPIIPIILLLVMSAIVYSASVALYPGMTYSMINSDWDLPQAEVDKFNEIGDQEEIELEFETEYIKYKEKATFELMNFEYKGWWNYTYTPITVIRNMSDEGGNENTSVNITMVTEEYIVEPDYKIIKKYESDYISFNTQGTEQKMYFDVQRCWVCGEVMTCLYIVDGGNNLAYRQDKFKCQGSYPYGVIRDGESGFIMNMTDGNQILQIDGD